MINAYNYYYYYQKYFTIKLVQSCSDLQALKLQIYSVTSVTQFCVTIWM